MCLNDTFSSQSFELQVLTGCEIDLVVTNKDSGIIFQFDKDGGVVTPIRA